VNFAWSTTAFAAEYGRALGGIVDIVTKSGTNDYHGPIYEYMENNAFNANSILTQPGFDTLRQNQFGGTLGWPVRKDKSFFFINYEGQRRAQSPTYPGLLTANLGAINALKTSFGIAPENLNVLNRQRAAQSATNGYGPWWNGGASHMNEAYPKSWFDRRGLLSLLDTQRRFSPVS